MLLGLYVDEAMLVRLVQGKTADAHLSKHSAFKKKLVANTDPPKEHDEELVE